MNGVVRPYFLAMTVTLNDAVVRLPFLSAAVHATFVVPTGKVVPDAGVQVTGTSPSVKSFADAAKVIAVPAGEVATTVMLPGIVTPGAFVSIWPASSFTSMHPM